MAETRVSDLISKYEVGSTTSIGRSTYFIEFASIFFIYFCARNRGEASKKLFGISIKQIDRRLVHNPAMA